MKATLTESDLKILTTLERYLFVIAVTFGVFASVLSTSTLVISFIEISDTFHLPLSTFHIRSVLFFAIFAINLPLFGSLSEDIGPKRQFMCGLLLFISSTFMCSVTNSWCFFIFFQCLQALADSLIVSTMPVLFRLYVPEENIGWAFGFQSALLSSAGLIGPPCGAFLASTLGWQSIYILLSFIACLACILAYFVIPGDKASTQRPRIKRKHPIESTGYILCGFISLTLLEAPRYFYSIIFFFLFSFLIIRLILVEKNMKKGHIFPYKGTKEYYNNLIRATLIYTASNMIFLFLPTFIRQLYHIDSTSLGIILTLDALIPLSFGIYLGRLADKLPYLTLCSGLLLSIIFLAIVLLLPYDAGVISFSLVYLLIGLASALITPSQWKITFFSVSNKTESGKHTGLYMMMQFLSGGVASLIYLSFSKYSPQNNLYFFNSFLFFCIGLNLLALLTVFYRLNLQKRKIKWHYRKRKMGAPKNLIF